jgi:hypothetical protein
MNRNFVSLFLAFLWPLSCGTTPKSPAFDPETILKVEGQFLKPNGEALAGVNIDLKNLNRFAYIDMTAVAINEISRALSYMFNFGFVFYPFYAPQKLSHDKEAIARPGYFVDSFTTDQDGHFSFQTKAGNLLRDAEGAINLSLVNQKDDSSLFGRYAFYIKKQDTLLPPLQLCDLGNLQLVETSENLTVSWLPEERFTRYVVSVVDANSRHVIWVAAVDEGLDHFSLGRSIIQDRTVLISVEAFETLEVSEMTMSCLSKPLSYEGGTTIDVYSQSRPMSGPNVPFKISQLTNGRFDDAVFLRAFNEKELTLDLGDSTSITRLLLYNLKLDGGPGSQGLVLSSSLDGENWQEILSGLEEERFMQIVLPAPIESRFLKFEFSNQIYDLQEIDVL